MADAVPESDAIGLIQSWRNRLEQVPGLVALTSIAAGRGVRIAVLDGPVDLSHDGFRGADLRCVPALGSCESSQGEASLHGTQVASLLFGQGPLPQVLGLASASRGII